MGLVLGIANFIISVFIWGLKQFKVPFREVYKSDIKVFGKSYDKGSFGFFAILTILIFIGIFNHWFLEKV